jgi:hypothetical protein
LKLREWDWDKQSFVDYDYPEELIRPFVDWILTTKAWQEDPKRVNAKVLQLQRALAEYRNPPDSHRETVASGFIGVETPPPVDAKLEAKRERMAKARAAKQAKWEAVHA